MKKKTTTRPKSKRKRRSKIPAGPSTIHLFTTHPHGAQRVFSLKEREEDFYTSTRNRLFAIRDTHGPEIILTGWELSDLARQWLAFAATCDR